MRVIIKNLAEVYRGFYISKKLINKQGNCLLLKPEYINNYAIEVPDENAVFLNRKTVSKFRRQDFIEYGDFIIYIDKSSKPSIIQYNGEVANKILPSKGIIILRTTNTYLSTYLQLLKYKNIFLSSLVRSSNFDDMISVVEEYSIDVSASPLTDHELEVEDAIETPVENTAESPGISYSDIAMTQKSQGMSTIISRIEESEINLNTKFQRAASLWDEDKKCKLIESILLQFPIPAFYFDASEEDNWQIVDGLQRLSTIKEFVIDKTLRLSNLDFLSHLNGKIWDELERKEQRRLLEFEIVVYLIQKGTPKKIKYNLFKRINSGALTLKDQEIRHALNQGRPADTLIEFSRFTEFKEVIQLGNKLIERMEDREIVLRYLAFRITHYTKYTGNIKIFLDKAMENIEGLSDEELKGIEIDFRHSLRTIRTIFGKHAFKRSIIDDAEKNRRFSKVLFEPWIFAVSQIDLSKRKVLIENRQNLLSVFKGYMRGETVGDESQYEFDDLINQQSYSSIRLINRFKMIENLVNKWSGND